MPSLIDLRRRIRSVKNTQQITKAMKLVSSARLRKAQERALSARPYAGVLHQILANVAAAGKTDERVAAHPLLAEREFRRVALVHVTSDRGLAGAFNTNLNKRVWQQMQENRGSNVEVEVEAIGRKGRDFLRNRGVKLTGEYLGLIQLFKYADSAAIAQKLMKRYIDAEIDGVWVVYNEFKSVVSQKLTVKQLLPIQLDGSASPHDYIFEQPPVELLDTLLPRYVENEIYSAMLESAAAEHAARMTAMDAATSNAADVIDKLTLFMNRVRQASITREIIEVVSGANALD